ncbi:MAG: tRNA pseudouridine(38-40) synthase TruA [SAR202 cluster bacterium]|nr:tRNA pseudouridine(38-40) synthase TruA [SAR202 cluster bacterium]
MAQEQRPASRLALIVEYDGGSCNGFQYQANAPSIQSEIEKAIHKFTGEEVRIRGASRTDAGVHAQGQVVDFLTNAAHPIERWVKALNFYLPWDIKVKAAYPVPAAFNARRSALSRTYRYAILNDPTPSPLLDKHTAWIKGPLDWQAMDRAAKPLIGTRDFSAFSGPLPPRRTPIRRVMKWDVWKEGRLLLIEAKGNAFLPHQILRTNGILAEVGKGRLSEDVITNMLAGSIMNRIKFSPLPSKGLTLIKVEYSNFPPEASQ